MVQMPKYVSYREKISAAHINSIIDALRKIQPVAGANVSLDQGSFGTRINAQPKSTAAGGSITITYSQRLPFSCRWMDKSEEGSSNNGEWQIYLPRGCATVTQGTVTRAYVPINSQGTNKEGESQYMWYAISAPQDKDATVVRSGNMIAKTWSVFVSMQPWPRMKVTTSEDDYLPHQWTTNVGSISEIKYAAHKEGEKEVPEGYKRETTHAGITSIAKTWDISKSFAIRYDIESDSVSASPKAYVINKVVPIGRLQSQETEPTDVTNWGTVWCKIDHPGETFKMSVVKDLSSSQSQSDDDKTCFQLYKLDTAIVESDFRDSIPTMNFYTSKAN